MAARAETYRIICGSHFDRAIPRDPVFTPTPTNSIPRDCSTAKAKFRTTSSSLRMALDTESAPGGSLHRHRAPPVVVRDPHVLENPTDKIGFVDGVILHPKPFTARFQLRLLRDEMAQYGEWL
ncbi:hypothetical protein DFJ58DRAFT_726978 [Suillus subalutaceus]|uniref:uncharacterized protein n=1 Tax=Suillus subalutaceus TaxID=48586 RepID=UPI001B867243|nr:uncharacterized protein DFJ58DRAFT_726978 [Suillus subalutaceus]KAG1856955.1 hypothetical protein DFJ58DRAFT_726978 [Suillus subalutaceus]